MTKTAKTKSPRKPRAAKKPKTLEMNMTMEAVAESADADAILEAVLAQALAEDKPDLIEEASNDGAALTPAAIVADSHEATDEEIEAAARKLAMMEGYAEQTSGIVADVPDADKPKLEGEGEAAPVKKAKEKKEKAPTTPRVTFHSNKRSTVLDDRLGGKTAEFLVLELSDAALSAEELAAKQDALKDELDNKLAKKVSEKAIMLFKWIKNGGNLNAVMKEAFRVLGRDGKLTSGQSGNLYLGLKALGYSNGTAASQANQMFMLFPFLKITVRGEKGTMVANPDSAIVAVVNTMLNPTPAA